MKRELMMALLGAAILTPADADGQRNRTRERERPREERAGQPAPVRAGGRIAYPVRNSGRFDRRSRVVYTSRGSYRPAARGHLWVRANWGPVRIRSVGYHRGNLVLKKNDLRHVLGRRTVDQVQRAGRRAGLRGAMRGHWVGRRGAGQVLIVTMGGVDVAEFADFDRDGFVDDVFLVQHSRNRRVVSRW